MSRTKESEVACLEAVIKRVLTEKSLDKFRENITSHALHIRAQMHNDDRAKSSSGITFYHFEYTQQHKEFQMMVESLVEECAAAESISMTELEEILKRHAMEPVVEIFATLMTLSTSFEVFMDTVKDEGKLEYVLGVLSSWRGSFDRK